MISKAVGIHADARPLAPFNRTQTQIEQDNDLLQSTLLSLGPVSEDHSNSSEGDVTMQDTISTDNASSS